MILTLDIAAEFAFFYPQVFSSEILDALEWKLIWGETPEGVYEIGILYCVTATN